LKDTEKQIKLLVFWICDA